MSVAVTTFQTIRCGSAGVVASIELNRPATRNAIDGVMRSELLAALTEATRDSRTRVIILSGANGHFCSGADLAERPSVTHMLMHEYKPIFDVIADSPQLIMGAIAGSAAGIGLSLALACDVLIMAADAHLLTAFTRMALVPDGGASWTLVRQLGYRRALEMVSESERVSAARALELGLVNRVVASAELDELARAWAHKLAELAPLSLAGTKKLMRLAQSASFDAVFEAEAIQQQKCGQSDDFNEAVAAFLCKRKPRFSGR